MARLSVEMGDTIYALSSAAGLGALAVIRVSGERAAWALGELSGRGEGEILARVVSRVWLREGDELLDEALATYFPGPASATGEDVVELSVHGGFAVVDGVLAALGRMEGLRPAEAGEFSWRGFLRGKLDLSQLEGLADLMAAESSWQRRLALSQLGGGLSGVMVAMQGELTRLRGGLEAVLEFPDDLEVESDGGEFASLVGGLGALGLEMDSLLAGSRLGERIRTGVEVVLVGERNVGKSSLFNGLLQRRASIVSAMSGTTRDLVEASSRLGGMAVTCVDTAGLGAEMETELKGEGEREGGGELEGHLLIEREGMSRAVGAARGALERGGIVVVVMDLRGVLGGGMEVQDLLAGVVAGDKDGDKDGKSEGGDEVNDGSWNLGDHVVVVLNKLDLAGSEICDLSAGSLEGQSGEGIVRGGLHSLFRGCCIYVVSAQTGAGLDDLGRGLSALVERGLAHGTGRGGSWSGEALISRARQRDALRVARRGVLSAEALLGDVSASGVGELVSEELRLASLSLGRILGGGDLESVLDSLFSEFCIGK
ncbi:MAG: 50S ribosome-binding GTPase [Alphaproteobacteria bacterium]